jgi:hypothetical protein
MLGGRAFRGAEEIAADLPDHKLFVIRQPRNVMQQISDADSPRLGREVGAMFVHRVVESNLVGHGREFELRIGRDGAMRLEDIVRPLGHSIWKEAVHWILFVLKRLENGVQLHQYEQLQVNLAQTQKLQRFYKRECQEKYLR